MVDNIIKSVAEKLSSLSYIEGIVLGGSRARGTHTEDSDIDIGIYYNSESFTRNNISCNDGRIYYLLSWKNRWRYI